MSKFVVFIITLGALFLSAGLFILFATFYPIIHLEVNYDISQISLGQKGEVPSPQITPVDTKFGIVIPKIKANSRVIPNVDPYNAAVYQYALTKGVAQAKGSAFPYENGNVFLFSHSSVNFYEAEKYNSIFYLLDKLEQGDTIYLYYAGQKYTYTVTGRKVVNPEAVEYLDEKSKNTLTLMTCWPPGTSLQRLLIQAQKLTPSIKTY